MEKDNVYVLFEEIKNKIEMINGKLEQKTRTPTGRQAEEVIPTCVRHIHRHSFDIRSSKVFSLLVGMGVVCSLSLWGNIRLWQSNRQYADDALKFRAIRSWSGCTPEDILWLNKVFDIHRDEKAIEWVRKQADGKAIEWVRKQADGYENELKAVSDSLMQEKLKLQVKSESD